MHVIPIWSRTWQTRFPKPVHFGRIKPALTVTSPRRIHGPSQDEKNAIEKTRNIGIIAHIDAGKTTTTERMLYYSGYTRRIGNVDEGSTITDFLPAERARGVTIQSAAISFHWPPLSNQSQPGSSNPPPIGPLTSHNINLIDTPGHADFTFEVVRSLRILDGAICILDGVAGVEAQTEKVWNQAAKYHIPKIIFVNKLDRDGASFERTVKEIAMRLHTWPALCQIPWWEDGKGRFMGLGDAIRLQAYRWPQDGDGRSFEVFQINDLTWDSAFGEEIKEARMALVELLGEHDESMVDKYLKYQEDHLAIPAEDILASLRSCVIRNSTKIVPVFAGASLRNIGVQPLLDAVVELLPSPNEVPNPEVSLSNTSGTLRDLLDGKLISTHLELRSKSKRGRELSKNPTKDMAQNLEAKLEACALAFKVVHDPRRGALVYVRVYSGQINRNVLLFNTNLQVCEKAQHLLKMYASDSVDVSNISMGQIGVMTGLKYTRTGDTLISYTGLGSQIKLPPAPLDSLQLRPIEVPPAVFFSSIEPNSLGDQKSVENALALMIREDPSLQVSVDEESGQTLLSGMGEFHLEIAGDRLVKDLKAKASMGNIEVAYREGILKPSLPLSYKFDRDIAGKRSTAGCVVSVNPLSDISTSAIDEDLEEYDFSTAQDGNHIKISIRTSDPSSSNPDSLTDNPSINENRIRDLPSHLQLPSIHTALVNGAIAALSRGIAHNFPLHDTYVSITFDLTTHLFPNSTIGAITSAARLATKEALQATAQQAGSALLELVMNVAISVDDASLGAVSSDISAVRGGHIISIDDDQSARGVDAARIDISKVYAPPDPFGNPHAPSSNPFDAETHGGAPLAGNRTINARVPLKAMVSYFKYLRSMTGGRGTFTMSPDQYRRVVGQREKVLLKELRGY
ncbi:Ribosome-releasing factor 2, mitochondrial [Sticta canariensis]|nr:Ribosome-releasing factor 2, mitochondrial [Sticta canariensis]